MKVEMYIEDKGQVFEIQNAKTHIDSKYRSISFTGERHEEDKRILTFGTNGFWNVIIKMNNEEVQQLIKSLQHLLNNEANKK